MFIHDKFIQIQHIIVRKNCEIYDIFLNDLYLLYFGQGLFKIRSEEMIHYVKEAKTKAFKTVERFTS